MCMAFCRLRAIGVSNFEERHLQELISVAKTKPAVNQVLLCKKLPLRWSILASRSSWQLGSSAGVLKLRLFVQIEVHPRLPQTQLLAACKKLCIEVTAYSPFGAEGEVSMISACLQIRLHGYEIDSLRCKCPHMTVHWFLHVGAELLRHRTVIGVAQAVNRPPAQVPYVHGACRQWLPPACGMVESGEACVPAAVAVARSALSTCRSSCSGPCRRVASSSRSLPTSSTSR